MQDGVVCTVREQECPGNLAIAGTQSKAISLLARSIRFALECEVRDFWRLSRESA